MSFEKVKELIKLSFIDYVRMSDVSLYLKAIKLLGSISKADEFMLHRRYGGYDYHELFRIKQKLKN